MLKSRRSAGEELGAVDLRSTLPDGDVETLPTVDARGHRVVEAAVLALRAPVRAEDDAICGVCARARRGATAMAVAPASRARRVMAEAVRGPGDRSWVAIMVPH